jgi:hypothetical protein
MRYYGPAGWLRGKDGKLYQIDLSTDDKGNTRGTDVPFDREAAARLVRDGHRFEGFEEPAVVRHTGAFPLDEAGRPITDKGRVRLLADPPETPAVRAEATTPEPPRR